MANRYWVGGSGTWDATAGSKWSLTSGGAGGQAVPTSSDDVFFNAASGNVTVTSSGLTTCHNLTTTGFTGILVVNVHVYADVVLASTGTYTGLALTMLGAPYDINTVGKTIAGIAIVENASISITGTLTCVSLGVNLMPSSILRPKNGVSIFTSSFAGPPYGSAEIRCDTVFGTAVLSCSSGELELLEYLTVRDIVFDGTAKWSPGTNFIDNGRVYGVTSLYSPFLTFGANF